MCVHGFKIKIAIETSRKIRIKDIAKLAGVSAGTVDRVIHNRGQVTDENRDRIQKIIDELNYKPNLFARSLASKRNYLFITLLPEHNRSGMDYWEAPINGVQKAWKEIADYNVTIRYMFFDQLKAESFRNKFNEMLGLNPDAVMIAPVFKNETSELSKQLDSSGIAYVFIDSNINDLENLAYFGQNSYQSGFLAARLLQSGLEPGGKIAIIKSSTSNLANQLVNRESGFNAFFTEKQISDLYEFVTFNYDQASTKSLDQQLIKFLNQHKPVAGAIVFNSRVFEVARVIEKYQLTDIKLIGYDLLKENVKYLRKEVITFLLAQRPEEQGYQGIMTLFDHLVLKKEISKVHYMPLDILTKENLDYYMNFTK